MKLNLSNLNKNNNTNTPLSTSFKLNTELSATSEISTSETAADNSAKLNLSGLAATPASTAANEEATGFSLTFTDSKNYNLDDIIFQKRRNNAACPLIVYVDLNNEHDVTIIELITKLILDDYQIEYTNENYKTVVNSVPLFSDVFDVYFNKYYAYYYQQTSKLAEGSLSLNTVIEQIHKYHDDEYLNSRLGETLQTYATPTAQNKTKAVYEYGTSPDNYTGGQIISNENVPTTLKVENNQLKLYHGDTEIPDQTPIDFKTINNQSIFGTGNLSLLTFDDYVKLLETDIFLTATGSYMVDSNDTVLLFDNNYSNIVDGNIFTAADNKMITDSNNVILYQSLT